MKLQPSYGAQRRRILRLYIEARGRHMRRFSGGRNSMSPSMYGARADIWTEWKAWMDEWGDYLIVLRDSEITRITDQQRRANEQRKRYRA